MSRLRPSRAGRPADAPLIPDKLYFRIGEVSDLAEVKPYVLRYWETEFPTLKPVKGQSGHRLYRRPDVEMVFEIKRLLYAEGFTIDGARHRLAEAAAGRSREKQPLPLPADGAHWKAIRRELAGILTILSRR